MHTWKKSRLGKCKNVKGGRRSGDGWISTLFIFKVFCVGIFIGCYLTKNKWVNTPKKKEERARLEEGEVIWTVLSTAAPTPLHEELCPRRTPARQRSQPHWEGASSGVQLPNPIRSYDKCSSMPMAYPGNTVGSVLGHWNKVSDTHFFGFPLPIKVIFTLHCGLVSVQ